MIGQSVGDDWEAVLPVTVLVAIGIDHQAVNLWREDVDDPRDQRASVDLDEPLVDAAETRCPAARENGSDDW